MSVTYLKKWSRGAEAGHQDVQATMQSMLDELEQGGEEIACHLSRKFDHWGGDILVSPEALESVKRAVPQKLKDDIRFAQDSIQRFAEAQKTTIPKVSVRANHLSFGDQP